MRRIKSPRSQALAGNELPSSLRLVCYVEAALECSARQSFVRSGFPGRAWEPEET